MAILLYEPWQMASLFFFATWHFSFERDQGKFGACIMGIIVYGSWHFLFYASYKFSVFERDHGKFSFMAMVVHGAWQIFVLCNMAIFFEWDHGKLSVCIMANVINGAWKFYYYIDHGKFSFFLQHGKFYFFQRDHGNLSASFMATVVYGAWQIFFLLLQPCKFCFQTGPWQT